MIRRLVPIGYPQRRKILLYVKPNLLFYEKNTNFAVMDHLTTDQFNSLYRESYEQLFYHAYGFTEDAEVCRDILSDVFERLWTNRRRIAPDTARSYLYQCVRNECIDHVRRQQLSLKYQAFIKESAEVDSIATPNEINERLALVKATIEEMPQKTRQVLEECYFNNKKYKEVADSLDVSTNTVKKHIVKALALLRERCRPKPPPSE